MRVKEYIYKVLKEQQEKSGKGISATELADKVQMRRNLVSQYLNELAADGSVTKTLTRPVLFSVISEEAVENEVIEDVGPEDVFSMFVGADGSLKHVIEQCRSAVQYPGKGLPILLNGSSGVGKSCLAELIYRYAVESGAISENAPFVTLNCADYASNPELLSALLFGYAKGSFTGAEQSKEGLIHRADKGYLFLDEVHRLNNESQEKLFLLMDKNEYRKIGEADIIRKAQVRLIFATTENPEIALIHTLRRRIPMIIHIPSLQDRPVKEKLELIRQFYYRESQIFKNNLCVAAQVVNFLLSFHSEGNVGNLQNTIRYSCASAYRTHRTDDCIFVDFSSLPDNCSLRQTEIKQYLKNDLMLEYARPLEQKFFNEESEYICGILEEFQRNYKEEDQEFSDIERMRKALYRVLDGYVPQEKDALHLSLMEAVVESFEKSNGVHLAMNTSKILACFMEQCHMQELHNFEEDAESAIQKLERYHFKLFSLAEQLVCQIESAFGVRLNLPVRFCMILYIVVTNGSSRAVCCNALIMAHGNSTAVSIASAVNDILGEFIFEAFDMPVHTSFELFTVYVKKYLERINKNYPVLILVDMGSLMEINNYIELNEKQELGIMDSVSTSLALEVGGMICGGEAVAEILKKVSEQAEIHCRYIPAKKRKKAVVCICISGIGTAEKIRNILKDFIQPDCELLVSDYMKILEEGKNNSVFQNYDVQCVVGTSNLQLDGIAYININHLIDDEDNTDIAVFVEKVTGTGKITDMNMLRQKIVKTFSLENLITRLVFLNPQTVIDDVELVIFDIEVGLQKKFDTDIRVMLFLHIAVLVERALLKNCEEDIYQTEEWLRAHEKEISITAKAFSGIEKKFNVHITRAEIVVILQLIEMRA